MNRDSSPVSVVRLHVETKEPGRSPAPGDSRWIMFYAERYRLCSQKRPRSGPDSRPSSCSPLAALRRRSSQALFTRSSAITGAMAYELIAAIPRRLNANASRADLAFTDMITLHSETAFRSAVPLPAGDAQKIGPAGRIHKRRKLSAGLRKTQPCVAKVCKIQLRSFTTAGSSTLSGLHTRK